MAKVIVDYLPQIIKEVETAEELQNDLNQAFLRNNETIRLMAIGINTIEFGDGLSAENIYCCYIPVSFGQAGTELTGTHNLNKVVTSIVGTRINKPGAIYLSKNPSGYSTSGTEVYLKSDTDSVSGVIIVV